MKKSIKLLSISSAMLGLVGPLLASPTTAFAASESSATTIEQSQSKNQISQQLINKVDAYVSVKNNTYTLDSAVKNFLTTEQFTEVKNDIDKANSNVKQGQFTINVNDKSYDETNPLLRKGNSHYTYKNFWWGTRYYFRSNAAVYEMDHELDNYSATLAVAGAIGGLASAGTASAVGAIGSAYFMKIRSDLDYMNNTHPHNYLYMDVNYTGIYSINVL